MSDEEMRGALDQFCSHELTVESLAGKFPACKCEQAKSPEGSPGPVECDELLRLFLTSPTHLRIKSAADLNKRAFRAADLKRAYSVGLSVCRLRHASKDELEYTARNLYKIQTANNGELGGLVGAVDFPAAAVRSCPDDFVPLCAHETPLDSKPDGGFFRPSHSDVVNSLSGMTPEEQKASRDIIYNQVIQKGSVKKAADVADFKLTDFIPKNAK